MSVTGRISPKKAPSKTDKFLATCGGHQVARHARVEELRHMVAEGRYEVDTTALAVSILHRALAIKSED